MERIENALKMVEKLMRGGITNQIQTNGNDSSINQAKNLFLWAISSQAAEEELKQTERDLFVSSAIKLHNKARNLTSAAFDELRALLKAAAAWIIVKFNKETSNSLCSVIKLLSKASQELRQFDAHIDHSLQCSVAAASMFARLSVPALVKSLPPIELQDLRIAAFHAYLTTAELSNDNTLVDKCIKDAFDIVQFLNGLKLHFIHRILHVGSKLTTSRTSATSIHWFEMTIHVIEDIIAAKHNAKAEFSYISLDDIMNTKVKALLSLAFISNELSHFDKALSCIVQVEKTEDQQSQKASRENIKQTVMVAKFSIHAKACDWTSAEESLATIIKFTNSHEVALGCVTNFIQNCNISPPTTVMEYFKTLALRFPSDPEFTLTRISNIRFILSAVQSRSPPSCDSIMLDDSPSDCAAGVSGSDMTSRAMELCRAVIVDHIRGLRTLNEKNFQDLQSILFSRIKWHRTCHSSSDWVAVVEWATLLLELLQSKRPDILGEEERDKSLDDHSGSIVLAHLHKIDALLELKQFKDAKSEALLVLETEKSTRTIVTAFKAILWTESEEQVVETLLALQRRKNSRPEALGLRSLLASDGDFGSSDHLLQLLLCSGIASEAVVDADGNEASRLESISNHLLRQWLVLFASTKAWRDVDLEDMVAGTFFGITAEVAQHFLTDNMSRAPIENERTLDAADAQSANKFETPPHKQLPVDHIQQKIAEAQAGIEERDEDMGEIEKNSHLGRLEASSLTGGLGHSGGGNTLVASNNDGKETRGFGEKDKSEHDEATNDKEADELFPSPPSQIFDEKCMEGLRADLLASQSTPNTRRADPPQEAQVSVGNPIDGLRESSLEALLGQRSPIEDGDGATLGGHRLDPLPCDNHVFGEAVVACTDSTQPQEFIEMSEKEKRQHCGAGNSPITESEANSLQEAKRTKPCGEHEAKDRECEQERWKSVTSMASAFGYPETINDLANAVAARYIFRSILKGLRSQLLEPLQSVVGLIDAVLRDGTDIATLGSFQDLEWLADLSWNMGSVLSAGRATRFLGDVEATAVDVCTDSGKNLGTGTHNTLLSTALREITAAEFFETAERMYGAIPYEDKGVSALNQSLCLLMSSGARLDANSATPERWRSPLLSLNDGSRSDDIGNTSPRKKPRKFYSEGTREAADETFGGPRAEEVSPADAAILHNNLDMALSACRRADDVLRKHAGFHDDPRGQTFRKVALVYEFSVECRSRPADALAFTNSREMDFLSLSATQLWTCTIVAEREGGGSIALIRRMLNMCKQMCHREHPAQYMLLGAVFVRLIELSSSRTEALGFVTEFEQLVTSTAHSSTRPSFGQGEGDRSDSHAARMDRSRSSVFSVSDVDHVTSLAFNQGVTLMELAQADLAEKFIARALSLLPFASPAVASWRTRMQEGYEVVLKKRAEEAVGRNDGGFGGGQVLGEGLGASKGSSRAQSTYYGSSGPLGVGRDGPLSIAAMN